MFKKSKAVDEHGCLIPVFHGTSAHVGPDFVFRADLIGTGHDEGYYGHGFYFALTRGEASFYGPNVIGAYLNLQNPLVLTNDTGDLTALGHFLDWAPKLKVIGALSETYAQALGSALNVIEYVRRNAEYLLFRGDDGSDGYMAKIRNPSKQRPFPVSFEVFPRFTSFKTKDAALESLVHRFIYELQYDTHVP